MFRDSEGGIVGAAIAVCGTVRKGPFAIRRVYLNTAGEDDADVALAIAAAPKQRTSQVRNWRRTRRGP